MQGMKAFKEIYFTNLLHRNKVIINVSKQSFIQLVS